MRMNHINLATRDLTASRAFLETYFGLRCVAVPDDVPVIVLADESDCTVTLSNFGRSDDVVYPAGFHIGFMQPSRAAVDAINERLRADGFHVGRCKNFHGAWTFYFKAPGGFTVEVGHQYAAPASLSA